MKALPRILIVMIAMAAMLTFAGCTEKDYEKIDSLAKTGQNIMDGADQAMDSPLGIFIPADWRLLAELVTGTVSALCAGWLNKRKNTYKQAATDIVRGGEIFKKSVTGSTMEKFSHAQDQAQSTATTKIIKKIKAA